MFTHGKYSFIKKTLKCFTRIVRLEINQGMTFLDVPTQMPNL